MGTLELKRLNTSDDFLTPPYIVKAMGAFDLDPCASHRQTENLAVKSFRFPEENGLLLPWKGNVFCNPPFSELPTWIERFILHGQGILLVPARIEVRWFWRLWHNCNGFFFTKGALKYIAPEGKNKAPEFFGSAFCAMGENNYQRLKNIPLKGIIISSRLIV